MGGNKKKLQSQIAKNTKKNVANIYTACFEENVKTAADDAAKKIAAKACQTKMGENLKESRVKVNPRIQLENTKKTLTADIFDMCVLDAETNADKKACRKKAINNCKENSVDGGKSCAKILKSGQQEKVKDLMAQMKADDDTVDKATFEAKAQELLKESMPGLTDKQIKKEYRKSKSKSVKSFIKNLLESCENDPPTEDDFKGMTTECFNEFGTLMGMTEVKCSKLLKKANRDAASKIVASCLKENKGGDTSACFTEANEKMSSVEASVDVSVTKQTSTIKLKTEKRLFIKDCIQAVKLDKDDENYVITDADKSSCKVDANEE